MEFRIDSFFNPHLSPGARRLDAVLTVSATGVTAGPWNAQRRKIGIVVDASPSMDQGQRIEAARHAARRCIAMLPANDLLTVVSFSSSGRVVVPLCDASEANKAQADRAVQRLAVEDGGTRMSRGLRALAAEFAKAPDAIGYGLMLTDGKNEDGDARDLATAIDALKGLAEVDCRGIGTDWKPDDLRRIASALLGTADAIPDPANVEADFRASLSRALSKTTGDVRLRVWRPAAVRLVALRQMNPEENDLTASGQAVDARSMDFRLGAWGAETRDYHVTFELDAGALGEEVMACRPSVVWVEAGLESKAAGTPVVATWSEDAAMTARINPEVAHYTGQAELASSIKEGLEAQSRGNVDEATRLLGRAAQIAAASGNDEVTRRLGKVVEVIDADRGTVRLRRDAGKGAVLELEMGGTRTVRRSPRAT